MDEDEEVLARQRQQKEENKMLDDIYNEGEFDGELEMMEEIGGEEEDEMPYPRGGIQNSTFYGNSDLDIIHEKPDDEITASGSKQGSPDQQPSTGKKDSNEKGSSKKKE
mmetsp:Transcript_29393/g.44415  ORF Transcript_29393/g.44415 Transcript_29393/m.44415 type:complete len:109 (-) Transcript_29393:1657-1983(-)